MTKVKSRHNAKSALPKGVDLSTVAPKTIELGRRCLQALAPPPRLLISEWADKNIILPDTSAEPGQWRTDRTPYLREVMDALCDPSVEKVVLMFASQTGKTAVMLNIAGYFIDCDPSPMMFVQPSQSKAKDFSKERLSPMIKGAPCLAAKVSESKSRDSDNTIQLKQFPGGFIVLVGANAPGDLASWPIRILLVDEIDRFETKAGKEGDPLTIVEARMSTFWNSKIIVASSPTIKGESRIEAEYLNSTREEWHVPCPSCGTYQPYEFSRVIFNPGEESKPHDDDPGAYDGNPEMACLKCGALHTEYEWKAGVGKWVANKEHATTRGFLFGGLGSPWLSWVKIVRFFLKANKDGPEAIKTFFNTRLAELYEEKGDELPNNILEQHRHRYECDVPLGANLITAGVDVQADRLEVDIVGWGDGKENWGIQYTVIPGDPHRTEVWNKLDALLERKYIRGDGAVMPISCCAVDSGYATSYVYAYARKRWMRYVFAIKGIGGPGKPTVGAYTRQGKNKNTAVWPVGTDASKDILLTRVMTEHEGPGYCHFPIEEKLGNGALRGYTEDYFNQLAAEKRVRRKIGSKIQCVWVKRYESIRNEALDCRVYAMAAQEIFDPDIITRPTIPTETENHEKTQPNRRGRRVLSKGIE